MSIQEDCAIIILKSIMYVNPIERMNANNTFAIVNHDQQMATVTSANQIEFANTNARLISKWLSIAVLFSKRSMNHLAGST